MNGYLLFAANLDDFRAIAKKFEPETLGESLARIAKPYLREKPDTDLENSEEVSSEIDNDSLPPIKGNVKHTPIKGKVMENPKETLDLSQNTFDELVERVKQRLTIELKPKKEDNNDKIRKNNNHKMYNNKNIAQYNKQNVYKKVNLKEKSKYVKDQIDFEEMSPFVDTPDYKEDVFNKPKAKKGIQATKTTKDGDYEGVMTMPLKYSKPVQKRYKNVYPPVKYPRPSINKKVVEEIGSTTEPSGLYEKLEFTQNDSYEDYVTPAKENIYTSSENKEPYNNDENKHKNVLSNKRYKIKTDHYFNKNFDRHARVKTKGVSNKNEREIEKSPINYEYGEKIIESEEIKAKTENLWYDNYEKVTMDTVIVSQTSKKPKFGTRLPTRHTFRMATPNFMANFPMVVEKYNFDEPIPEKDRERESLKYIGNPPASINKKVQLL
ncbi:uncharacterized protein PF3D7_1120000-like [Maniola hyperantus]|uniref:uncharacterized protein PF3D7_1120000-like n=1 Tax=Aphantopus hyperantus TaxID=2795564 RepID=UPI0037482A82